jgi:hypothetical protein
MPTILANGSGVVGWKIERMYVGWGQLHSGSFIASSTTADFEKEKVRCGQPAIPVS